MLCYSVRNKKVLEITLNQKQSSFSCKTRQMTDLFLHFYLFFYSQITALSMCELHLAKLTEPHSSVPDRAFCASPDGERAQMLNGSGFVGHSCRGNSSPSCCFAVALLQCAFAASKSH